MTLKDDLMRCVVTEVIIDGDGDLRALTLSSPSGEQYIVDPNDDGYQIMDVLRTY